MRITIGQRTLAIGLIWQLPANNEEVKRERSLKRDSQFVLVKSDHQFWLGFAEQQKGSSLAGALVVGLVHPNCVIFHDLGDGQAWICNIKKGMPIVGRDQILPEAEASRLVRDWISALEDPVVVGDAATADFSLAACLEQLSQFLTRGEIKRKQMSQCELSQPIRKADVAMATIGAVIAVASVTAALFYYKTSASTKSVAQTSDAARLLQRQIEEQAARKKSTLQKAAAEIFAQKTADARASFSTRPNPAATWAAIASLRAALPISYLGYKPQSVDCVSNLCKVAWRADGPAALISDKLRLPNVEANFSRDKAAVSDFTISPRTEAMPAEVGRNGQEAQFLLFSYFNARYPSFQFSEPRSVEIEPPPNMGLTKAVIGQGGTWHVTFTGSTALVSGTEFFTVLAQVPVKVTSIKYSTQASSLEIAGEYFRSTN